MKIFLYILMDILIVAIIVALIIIIKVKIDSKQSDLIEKKNLEMFKNPNLYKETEEYEEQTRHIDDVSYRSLADPAQDNLVHQIFGAQNTENTNNLDNSSMR